MISLIAALQKDRGIGYQGKLPWRIPEDLKHFKELTTGHPIIMGRKTYESIGKPLPGRTNIVVSTQPREYGHDIISATSIESALEAAKQAEGSDEIFVIGGSSIYQAALPFADTLYLTLVEATEPVDTYFPAYEKEFPVESSRNSRTEGPIAYHFTTRTRT
jgi:dihydrofolate reductase